MIFNSYAYYLLFLIPCATLYRNVSPGWRPWLLSAFGTGFFVYFSLTSVGGAPGAACLMLFVWEALFSRLYAKGSRWCIVGVVQSIAILVAFKYWNFLSGLVFGGPEVNPWFWRGAFLPLGISFFTFEFIHYAVDRWRGTAEPGGQGRYLSFILFFPTMVAGPIKRFQDFNDKLASDEIDVATDVRVGTTRILVGLVKKLAVADLMTAFTDHLNAADIATARREVLPLWLVAYSVKIYFDFSGYSDIAIGSARLFGIRVPENFDWPYLQSNIAEFWRHWHISLSRWLTDYIFIPLGGSRASAGRTSANLMVTMLVSGLWHGAGLNFIAWGAWHGALLLAHRSLVMRFGPAPAHRALPIRALAVGATFACVTLGWAFFAMDLPTASLLLHRMVLG